MTNLITIASFFNTEEAYLVKGLLENEGIEAVIFDEHAAAYTPIAVGGVRLVVKQSDLERAKQLLSTVQMD